MFCFLGKIKRINIIRHSYFSFVSDCFFIFYTDVREAYFYGIPSIEGK